MIDFFQHNLDLIEHSRKQFFTHFDADTILTDKTDYVWNPEWYHDIPNGIKTSAIEKLLENKNCFKITPVTRDTTPLNYKKNVSS